MKAKLLSARYRKVAYIVLLVLICAALLIRFRNYKQAEWDNRIQVYDLKWSDKNDSNNIVYRRWRYFVETKTSLTRKIEKYSKTNLNDEYILRETLVISYPTDEQIRWVIKDVNF